MSTGIDIAWDRPSIAEIKATGASWVARYFSPDPTKNLHASEVTSYGAAGLGIVTVYEGAATRALAGRAAGVSDAQAAVAQNRAVGLPDTTVIHFAVDTDTDWASVAPYFDGVISVLGLARTGTYGGLKVINGAHTAGIRYLWQTVAWSSGVWSPYATIRQPGGMTLAGNADFDTSMASDFGQYPRPSETDMDATQAQMLVDIHNALATNGWGFRNPQEDAAALKASGGKQHSLDAWGKTSTTLANTNQLLAQVAALSAVVAQLAKGGSLTAAEAQAAAQAGAAAALAEAEAAAKRVVDALQPPTPPAAS